MRNKKGFIIAFLAILMVIVFALIFKKVNINNLAADSGFDSSWDSGSDWGGSDWGGSDWGSSDWGSSSFDYDGSSSGGKLDPATIMLACIICFAVCAITVLYEIYFSKNKHVFYSDYKEHILKDNKEALENIVREIPNFNKAEFYDYVFKNFCDIQNAWMEFDYDTLRKLVTDELYNTYKSQLKTLERKNQKNIMSNFTRADIAIIKYYKSGKKHNIEVKMTVRFFDYLVDKNNKLIRGTNKDRIIVTYRLTYVSSGGTNDNRCPNCNAPLDTSSQSNVCPYCRSTIVSDSHDFILSKKEAVEQRSE